MPETLFMLKCCDRLEPSISQRGDFSTLLLFVKVKEVSLNKLVQPTLSLFSSSSIFSVHLHFFFQSAPIFKRLSQRTEHFRGGIQPLFANEVFLITEKLWRYIISQENRAMKISGASQVIFNFKSSSSAYKRCSFSTQTVKMWCKLL